MRFKTSITLLLGALLSISRVSNAQDPPLGIVFRQPIDSGTYSGGSQVIIRWEFNGANFTDQNQVTADLQLGRTDSQFVQVIKVLTQLTNAQLRDGANVGYTLTLPTDVPTSSKYSLIIKSNDNNRAFYTPLFTINNGAVAGSGSASASSSSSSSSSSAATSAPSTNPAATKASGSSVNAVANSLMMMIAAAVPVVVAFF